MDLPERIEGGTLDAECLAEALDEDAPAGHEREHPEVSERTDEADDLPELALEEIHGRLPAFAAPFHLLGAAFEHKAATGEKLGGRGLVLDDEHACPAVGDEVAGMAGEVTHADVERVVAGAHEGRIARLRRAGGRSGRHLQRLEAAEQGRRLFRGFTTQFPEPFGHGAPSEIRGIGTINPPPDARVSCASFPQSLAR